MFEIKLKNMNDMKIINDMSCIHDNKVDNISERNLLHYILNPSKPTKNINSHYSPLLNGCMNTRQGKAKFKKF